MLKKSLPIVFISFFFLHLYSQKTVCQLPVNQEINITNPAFFYTLPKTAFKVDVVVTKISNIKGLYADFAEKMLGITNYCKESSTSFELKNISVTPFTVPDESLQFVAELSSYQMKTNFLQSLYANNTNINSNIFSSLEQNKTDILPEFFKNYADVMLQHTYETYTETRIIDGFVTQVPVTQTKITTKTLSQQAQEAADNIEKIRNDRYAILSFSQEVTLSKEAFEYLVNQLNELEKKYLELFSGITVLEDMHYTLVKHPDPFSALLSVCSVTPNEGFSASTNKVLACNYYLKCSPQAIIDLQSSFKTNYKTKNYSGYRVRKAVPTLVSLVNGEKEELLGIFPVYQFGLLETLPANLNNFEIEKWGYIY